MANNVYLAFVLRRRLLVGFAYSAPLWQHIMLNVGVVVISVVLAWCVYKTYDLPVRKWLTEKWLKRGAKA